MLGLVLSLLVAVTLTACTEVDQRAVRPGVARTSPEAGDAAASGNMGTATGGMLGAVSPEGVLPDARRIYFVNGRDLWQLPVDNPAAPVVVGRDLLAYSPSPDGEQVAVIFQGADGNAEQIAIINADSTVALELGGAQGGQSPLGDVRSLAWSPRGLMVAVARLDGSITVVGADGSMRVVVPPGAATSPGRLQWSPDGATIAFLDPALPGRASSLSTVTVETGARRDLVRADEASGGVVAATWIPGRPELAYIRSDPALNAFGGDIFAIDPATGAEQLLVSSGRFAPVAELADLAVSPDGKYLAFPVYVPDGEEAQLLGLWTMDLMTREFTEVPMPTGTVVTDLWWASGTLLYRAIDRNQVRVTDTYTGVEPFALYQYAVGAAESVERYRRP